MLYIKENQLFIEILGNLKEIRGNLKGKNFSKKMFKKFLKKINV